MEVSEAKRLQALEEENRQLKHAVAEQGDEVCVQGTNLSTGGMGLDGLKEPMRFAGLLDVSFPLPDTENVVRAKARIVWVTKGASAFALQSSIPHFSSSFSPGPTKK
jgi:hypothetical protein